MPIWNSSPLLEVTYNIQPTYLFVKRHVVRRKQRIFGVYPGNIDTLCSLPTRTDEKIKANTTEMKEISPILQIFSKKLIFFLFQMRSNG